jgi:MFS family permease
VARDSAWLCWATALITIAALFPNYLVDYLHLALQQMGFVLSSLGVGRALGALILPSLSDRIERKRGAFLGDHRLPVHLGVCAMQRYSGVLFLSLMGATFAIYSLITLTVGPISAESVPKQLMSTASG